VLANQDYEVGGVYLLSDLWLVVHGRQGGFRLVSAHLFEEALVGTLVLQLVTG
jgi:hypothetical protein